MKVCNVEQFQTELEALLERYSHESDITVSEVIGCLEIAKQQELIRVFMPGLKNIAQDVLEGR